MNIAINTRLVLRNRLEGIGWFTYETVGRMARNHPEHNFIFIFDRPVDPGFVFSDNVKTVVAGPPTRHPVLWYIWFEWVIPRILRKHKADLFISPDGYASLRTRVPTITVIHDLNYVYHPEYLPKLAARYFNYFIPRYASRSKRIGTVSEYSRQDIAAVYQINPDIIDVYYNGANDLYQPVSETIKSEIRTNYTQGKDYFIFVGALSPRKNIPGLLKAYDIYRVNGGTRLLLIVGDAMHKTGEIDLCMQQMQFAGDVLFSGRLRVEELSRVMASASALVMVPFFEGFGIPLVEAMYCDVPVICSNTTSLPEVVGDAALMCDPNDHESIASNMGKLESDETLRMQLIANGRIQRTRFSWDKSAERLWMSVEKVLSL